MTPYSAYKLYMGVKLHFERPDYDVVKARGAVRVKSQEQFSRTNAGLESRLRTLIKTYSTPKDLVQLSIALCIFNGNIFDQDSCDTLYRRWIKIKESATQVIIDELQETNAGVYTEDWILRQVAREKMSIITAVAIDNFYDVFDVTTQNLTHNSLKLCIIKLKPFVKYDTQRVEERFLTLESHEDHEISTV